MSLIENPAIFDRRATETIVMAAEKLVEAISLDDKSSGGLLSRQTIRLADELRIALLRWRKRGRA